VTPVYENIAKPTRRTVPLLLAPNFEKMDKRLARRHAPAQVADHETFGNSRPGKKKGMKVVLDMV
jgi:hypothetical protein